MGYEHPDDWKKIAAKLDQDTAFAAEFKKVYPQGFTGETITNAIAEYEKTLITPNSPFDRYLKGDENAISENAKKGYKLFLKLGCQTCHTGPAMGGQSFEYADLKGDFFAGRAKTNDDNGLMNFSKRNRTGTASAFRPSAMWNSPGRTCMTPPHRRWRKPLRKCTITSSVTINWTRRK